MAEIRLYKTTAKGLKIIGLSLPFLVLGIWTLLDGPYGSTEYIMTWIVTCFFGLGLPFGLFQAFDKRPQIIISEKGIWDRTTKQDEVKWEQIIEAYHFDIYGQKFISLVTDDTFVFKKKPYKWATKINEFVGAQNLNLNLGQINIDERELTKFINFLCKKNSDERLKLITSFTYNKANFTSWDFQKVITYVFISVLVLLLSLYSFAAFAIIMTVTLVSVRIARERPENSVLKKYARIGTWLGFCNMVLYSGATMVYDKLTLDLAERLTIKIEEFQKLNKAYPADIKSIKQNLRLNFAERYLITQIDYTRLNDDYELEANLLQGRRETYDKELEDWE